MKHWLNIILTLFALLVLAGCSGDDSLESIADSGKPIVFGFVGSHAPSLEWTVENGTRTGEETTLPADLPDSIGVFAYNNKETEAVFYNEKFLRNDDYKNKDTLITTDKKWVKAEYKFIGYAPYSYSGVSPINSTFSGFSTLSNTNIPAYSTEPYYQSSLIEVTYPSTNSEFLKGDTVKMKLEHLTSRLRFCFKLGDKYGDLRIIHVREVRVKPNGADEFLLLLNEKDSDGNRIDSVEISAAKEKLGFQPLASLYVKAEPSATISSLTISVKYDVLDKKKQLLRKGEVSENSFSTAITLDKGTYRDLQITVEPKFLYVLSDNDVEDEAKLTIN